MRNPKKDGLTNKSQWITVARDRQSFKKTSLPSERRPVLSISLLARTQPTKGAGTLRRAVRRQVFARIPGGRHMECAYYFDFVDCVTTVLSRWPLLCYSGQLRTRFADEFASRSKLEC